MQRRIVRGFFRPFRDNGLVLDIEHYWPVQKQMRGDFSTPLVVILFPRSLSFTLSLSKITQHILPDFSNKLSFYRFLLAF